MNKEVIVLTEEAQTTCKYCGQPTDGDQFCNSACRISYDVGIDDIIEEIETDLMLDTIP